MLLDERPERSLGAALVWAERARVTDLHVLVDDPGLAGVLARRATAFRRSPRVLAVEGRTAVPAAPAPVPAPVEPPAAARELVGMLRDAGAEVTVEHGQIRGEVRGLEVARVVVDGTEAHVEVGVGRHDREAFAMLHGDLPTSEALSGVVADVDRHRRAEAEAHPLRRLAGERWLRWRVVAEPGLVGAEVLRPAEPTVPRESVKDVSPAIAVGRRPGGEPVVVACSVGIDLDLVPAAADARLVHDPDARLVVVVPERDDHPVTRRLAAALTAPAEVVPVPGDWRRDVGARS